jgi:hypothetical protein
MARKWRDNGGLARNWRDGGMGLIFIGLAWHPSTEPRANMEKVLGGLSPVAVEDPLLGEGFELGGVGDGDGLAAEGGGEGGAVAGH